MLSKAGFSLNFRGTSQLEKVDNKYFLGMSRGFWHFEHFEGKKSSIDLFILVASLSFLYFRGSLMFLRTEITKPIKIIIEKLLHISRDFLSVSVRSWAHQIVSSININKCIKYKPGSNSNIQNKGDLWSYFKLKTFFILYFFLLMTIVQCKYLLKCK